MKTISKILMAFIIILTITSCSLFKSSDGKNEEETILKKKRINPNVDERARAEADKNGIVDKIMRGNKGGGSFEFASSNVMWRATLEAIEFMPLQQIDYAGGLIITDWYSEKSSNESIKITFRFLSSDLATSSIKVISHKRTCDNSNNCETKILPENFNTNIKDEILNKARELKIKNEKNK